MNVSKYGYIKHVLFFLISTILLYLTCSLFGTITDGDGTSYMLTSWAISNHQSPDIRAEDTSNLSHLFVDGAAGVVRLIAQTINEGKQDRILTFVKDKQGKYYDVHFWFYPLICSPIASTLTLFHLNQFRAFQIANALIIIFGLFYLLYMSSLPLVQRITISTLYLFEGIFFYLRWPHPEVLMATAVLLSATAMIEKQKYLSVIFASIGALQNPVICLFIPVIFLYNLSDWIKLDLKHRIVELLKSVGCALVSIIPFVFYYIKFGKFSLISVSISEVGFNISRLFSFFFDLNQGMIVGMPAILLATLFILLCSLLTLIKWIKPLVFRLLNNTNFEYKNALLVIGSL